MRENIPSASPQPEVAATAGGRRARPPRLSCQFTVSCQGEERSFSAVVSNISLGGLRLQVSDRLKKGEELVLQFRSPSQGSVPCRVQWCRRLPKRDVLLVGVVFTSSLAELRGTWLIEVLEALDTIQAYYQGLAPKVVEPPLARALSLNVAGPAPWPDSPSPGESGVDSFEDSFEGAIADSLEDAVEPEIVSEPEEQAEPEAPAVIESAVVAAEPEPAAEVHHEPEPHVLVEMQGEEPSNGHAVESVDIGHLIAPPESNPEWARLLQDAQRHVNHAPPLLSRMLNGLRSFAVEEGVSLVERRRVRRIHCHLDIICNRGGSEFESLVVDISPSGLGLETAYSFRRGVPITVLAPRLPEYKGLQPLVGKVRHNLPLKHRVGLILDPSDLTRTWMGLALRLHGFSRAHLEEKRRYVRARTYLAVEARGWRGDFTRGYFLDLGRGGALLQSPQAFQKEEQVRLVVGPLGTLPLLYLPALVVNQRRDLESGGWLVSLRFLESTRRRSAQLDQYILAVLTSNPS